MSKKQEELLNIKEVRVTIINDKKMLAFASIKLEGDIIFDGIKLFQGDSERYIIFPSKQDTKRNFTRNVFYPSSETTRKQILEAVSTKYDEIQNTKVEETE